VKVLTEVDRTGVEKALDAAHSLPSPQDCADLEALSQQQPRPADPARRAELERLEGRLAEARSLLEMSRYAPALAQVLQLRPQVLATDYLPLVAELGFHQGWLQSLLGNKEEGARLMEQAVYDAEAGRADKLEVAILGKLVFAEGKRERFEQAEQWGRLGSATLRRLGGEPVLEADLLLNRANLALWRTRPEEARQLLERARELQAQALAPGHPKRARVSFTLGMTLLELGELEPATAMLEEALKQTEAAVGPLHLDVARRHNALSNVLREKKDFARALGHARQALALQKQLLGPRHLDVAYALDELGMSLLALGQHEEALRVYQESLELKRALVESEEDEDLQYSYDGVGQALLGLGRTQEALEPLRRAVAFEAPEDVLADSGFALARALWQEGQQAEARSEAARAEERFSKAGKDQRAGEVRAWLQSLPEEKVEAPAPKAPPKRKSKRRGGRPM
jgi:tetratricopeptide (TPR) repeat protein